MQRLSLPAAGQAQGGILNRLWRSIQAGVPCKHANGAPVDSTLRTDCSGDVSTSAIGSHSLIPPIPKLPRTSYNPPANTRGFAASASSGSPFLKKEHSRDGRDGFPTTLEEYNDVLLRLGGRLLFEPMRDVFDDLILDGITPDRSTYHIVITGGMRARALQNVLFFYDRMMMQGLIPDSNLFHNILRTCAHARHIDKALEVAEVMEAVGTPTTAKTYQHLLNACAKAGQVEKADAVVEKMKTKGLVLNKFCYAALITTIANQRPHAGRDSTGKAVINMLNEARRNRDAWTDIYEVTVPPRKRGSNRSAQFLATDEDDEPEERLDLVVYKAAVVGCGGLYYKPGVLAVMAALREDKVEPDGEMMHSMLSSLLSWRYMNEAIRLMTDYPNVRLGTTSDEVKKLVSDAAFGKNVTLIRLMLERLLDPKTRTFLAVKDANDLLNLTDKLLRRVDVGVCKMAWEVVVGMKIKPWLGPAKDHLRCLTVNNIPPDDPHYKEVHDWIETIQSRALSKTPFKASKKVVPETKEEGTAEGAQGAKTPAVS